jgi:hypothetical protein
MSAMSDYLENRLIDHVLGRTSFTMPSTYLALYTASPGETGTATTNETSVGGYARAALGTGGSSKFPAASGGSAANSGTINCGTATGSVTITHFGIVDSASGAGNLLLFGALTTARSFVSGDVMEVPISGMTVSMA